MNTTIDQGAVAAIAHAALANVPCERGDDAEWDQPELAAWGPLGLNDVDYDVHEGDLDFLTTALELYKTGFAFALQLGARIGADPLHAPEIKDLIKQYRVERKEAA